MAGTEGRFGKEPVPEKPEREMSFKEKLDKAADEARQPSDDGENDSFMKPIIEKVTEYIPAATSILGDPKKEEEERQAAITKPTPGGPPERPIHDHNIEQFVKDQHRSKGEDGKLVN
ncbi:hypothetical protein F5X68DRAFT_240555 [Plectosphaerella plurivora]|uniref:Uncharacterized protein n=1 Tax=Plectosphaerella plurivora TaxID=936078 RepID=A0A9P8VBH6_9PEZI|nr:hypothetical protein F5X68DRAFT_240555 [Plectosphaerella plurivora]